MPTTLTLPPFRGAVRRLVLINVGVFFALAILRFVASALLLRLLNLFELIPAHVLSGWVWQLLSYSFINTDLLSTALNLIFLWYTGAMLEELRGSRWFNGLFYLSAIGGSLLATLLAGLPLFTGGRVALFGLQPLSATTGIPAALFGVLVAFGTLYAEVEILFFFVLRMKVKYLIAIYTLLDLAFLILGRDPLGATVALCSGLCGFLYVRYAARQGYAMNLTERYFGIRNDYYRWKRRRAARKFEVYMRKQDREVHFDNEGRYISPEDERRKSKNPNDTSWMN